MQTKSGANFCYCESSFSLTKKSVSMYFYYLKNKREQKEKSTVCTFTQQICRDTPAQLKLDIPAFTVQYDAYNHTDL